VSETAEANTINQLTRYLNITLDLPGQPVIPVTYIFSNFDAGAPSSAVLLRNQWFFPNPVIHGTWSSTTYWWSGTLSPTKVTAADYILSGSLSFDAPNGMANLTFGPNHIWTCSGDCVLYAFWPPTGQFIPSSISLTSGTYSSYELPLPATGGMAIISVGALFALFGRSSRRNKSRAAA